MNFKSWLLIVAAVSVAAGCATSQEPAKPVPTTSASSQTPAKISPRESEVFLAGFDPALFTRPDRFNVAIYVDTEELLTIDQEPVRRSATDSTNVKLVWLLEKDPNPYVFPDNDAIHPIQVEGTPIQITCGRESEKKFVCRYTANGPAKWKYIVRVLNKVTQRELTKLDPWVHQN
ncbi:MAG TPA: hypothetical protein PLW68_14575 [Casimicrobiaceae bacterium]|nr:hypothetical protein [Casimicrobiaceae bacterium]